MSPELANEVRARGSLQRAITALRVDECHDLLREALRVQRAEKEASETLDQRAFRLGLRAADLDAQAERHMAAAADAAGMAAGRRLKGNDDEYARSFDREAKYCTEMATEASAEAARLRSQAASLHRAKSFADAVVSRLEGVS